MVRVFRVLRLVGRNDNLKIALKALFLALPNILNSLVIMLLFFFIFGVFVVSFFKGVFFYCEHGYLAGLNVLESTGTAEGRLLIGEG
jgi:hypothetical protein